MNKETVEQIIKDYENNKQNKKYCLVIDKNNERFGQTSPMHKSLKSFKLYDENTLLIEFGSITQYVSIESIASIDFRNKIL